jgi:hypothetical protein
MFDLDVPPLQQASRLDIDLPGRLGDENTVAGCRVEARCRAASKPVKALSLPPTVSVLVVIRDGIAHSAASASPLAPGDYVLALARPEDLALLDRVFGPPPARTRADERGLLGEFALDGTTPPAAIAQPDPLLPARGRRAGGGLDQVLATAKLTMPVEDISCLLMGPRMVLDPIQPPSQQVRQICYGDR